MQIPPGLYKFLQSLGVNTTRLQWRMYEWEKRREEPRERGLPKGLKWMRYQHKFCPNCNGLVDRGESVCPSCGAKVPSMGVYKVLRTIGLVIPEGGAITIMSFVALIVLCFILMIVVQGPSALRGLSNLNFRAFGGMYPSDIDAGEYWRMLSFGLLHFGLMHIGFNTIALIQVGPVLETRIGSKKMLVLITATQLTSAIAVKYYGPGAIGASGWLFGLLGFGAVYFHRYGSTDTRNFYVQWALYGFIFGFIFGFNNWAHGGGFVGGALLGLISDLTPARRHPLAWIWDLLFWPSLIAWAATLFFMGRSIINLW